jgi:CheY-like chemotaxis protein
MDNAHLRVAIIDDEPLAREGIRMLLASDPEIEVVAEAGSGFDAVSVIRRLRPELVFLDVQMPEMNGFEAVAAIRALEHAQGRPHTPIVAVTAHAMVGDRERCLEAGMDDYVTKPVSLAVIEGTLQRLLATTAAA